MTSLLRSVPLLALLAAPHAHAARTGVLSVTGADDLLDGEPTGISVDSDGALRLAPALSDVATLDGGPTLSLACDAKGNCYAASAQPGRITHVDPAGKTRVLFKSNHPMVTAVVLDGKGGLFAATAPSGEVLRMDVATGKSEVWWEGGAKVVWGLAFDGTQLWAVTADPGALWRIKGKGQAERMAEKALTDSVYRSVAALPGGKGVVLGAGRKGVVTTVDNKGTAFAHLDSTLEEVTSLAVRADGVIAAALASAESKGKGDEDLLKFVDGGDSDDDDETEGKDARTSDVVVLQPNGDARRVWRSKKDTAFAVAFDGRGELWIATGPRGRLYRADVEGRRVSLVARTESRRITALATRSNTVVLGTSHTPRLLALADQPARSGTYLSDTVDGERHVRFGRAWLLADLPAGTAVELKLRSGNTLKPDDTWSAWSPALTGQGGPSNIPPARFAQFRVQLTTAGKATPVLRELHVAHRAINLAPSVIHVDVLAPGVRAEPMPNDEPKGRTFTVGKTAWEEFKSKPLQSPTPEESAARAKQTFEPGWRTVTWHATDEDDDDLLYRVDLQNERGETVRTLGTGLRDAFVAMEDALLPDGVYRVRVTAEDVRSNPATEALRDDLTSDAFVVDHTAPTLTGKVTPAGVVTLSALDASPIIALRCALDAGTPVAATPADGLLDGPQEDASASLGTPSRGKHWVTCQAEDAQGNVARWLSEFSAP